MYVQLMLLQKCLLKTEIPKLRLKQVKIAFCSENRSYLLLCLISRSKSSWLVSAISVSISFFLCFFFFFFDLCNSSISELTIPPFSTFSSENSFRFFFFFFFLFPNSPAKLSSGFSSAKRSSFDLELNNLNYEQLKHNFQGKLGKKLI